MIERQVKCPFFCKRKSACVHSCEGWRDGMCITMTFPNGNEDSAYACAFCYRDFWRCPLYRTIMSERFPDCAAMYDGVVLYHDEFGGKSEADE